MTRVNQLEQALAVLQPLVKAFARQELGCGCAEEVFDHLELLWGARRPAHTEVALVVGRRLLICLVSHAVLEGDPGLVAEVVRACVGLRDEQGLNRCRIVIRGKLPASLARDLDEECRRHGERVHLHLF